MLEAVFYLIMPSVNLLYATNYCLFISLGVTLNTLQYRIVLEFLDSAASDISPKCVRHHLRLFKNEPCDSRSLVEYVKETKKIMNN